MNGESATVVIGGEDDDSYPRHRGGLPATVSNPEVVCYLE